MIILLEFQPNTDEGTDASVKSVMSSNPVCQIDPSEIWKNPKEQVRISLLSKVIGILLEF